VAALQPDRDKRPLLQDAERQALMEVLEAKHWHLTRVAEHLGISRNTLYRKLGKHGITRAD
jgi:transcriptional regulator of acetoin/glycerol metabolism